MRYVITHHALDNWQMACIITPTPVPNVLYQTEVTVRPTMQFR